MCKISPSLKLCTCKVEDASTLENYWRLLRPYEGDYQLIGEVMIPRFLDIEDEQHNCKILPKALNSANCFDVVLDIKEKDILDLNFTCGKRQILYSFVFKKGKWKLTGQDLFLSDEIGAGEIGGLKSVV